MQATNVFRCSRHNRSVFTRPISRTVCPFVLYRLRTQKMQKNKQKWRECSLMVCRKNTITGCDTVKIRKNKNTSSYLITVKLSWVIDVPIYSSKDQRLGRRPHNMSALNRRIFLFLKKSKWTNQKYTAYEFIHAITGWFKKHLNITILHYKRCFIKRTPCCFFFHNSLKWWSIYTKFVPVVAEEILVQNIATKYGSWLLKNY